MILRGMPHNAVNARVVRAFTTMCSYQLVHVTGHIGKREVRIAGRNSRTSHVLVLGWYVVRAIYPT